MNGPWTFEHATEQLAKASGFQADAIRDFRTAVKAAAASERAYRIALAKEIVRQHTEDGVAWTVAGDLARGQEAVAELKFQRDLDEGMKEAAMQHGWRRAADRKDAQRFADWSQRREMIDGPAT